MSYFYKIYSTNLSSYHLKSPTRPQFHSVFVIDFALIALASLQYFALKRNLITGNRARIMTRASLIINSTALTARGPRRPDSLPQDFANVHKVTRSTVMTVFRRAKDTVRFTGRERGRKGGRLMRRIYRHYYCYYPPCERARWSFFLSGGCGRP